jgi:hypothetical protein
MPRLGPLDLLPHRDPEGIAGVIRNLGPGHRRYGIGRKVVMGALGWVSPDRFAIEAPVRRGGASWVEAEEDGRGWGRHSAVISHWASLYNKLELYSLTS